MTTRHVVLAAPALLGSLLLGAAVGALLARRARPEPRTASSLPPLDPHLHFHELGPEHVGAIDRAVARQTARHRQVSCGLHPQADPLPAAETASPAPAEGPS